MDANSAGIISSATGRVQIGWNAAPGISHYRAYLFAKTDAGYTLDQKSDSLPYSAAEYTFENLESKNYEIQVVGYNMRGDAVSVYPVIALNMSGIGGGEDSSGRRRPYRPWRIHSRHRRAGGRHGLPAGRRLRRRGSGQIPEAEAHRQLISAYRKERGEAPCGASPLSLSKNYLPNSKMHKWGILMRRVTPHQGTPGEGSRRKTVPCTTHASY